MDSRTERSALSANGQKSPQIRLGDPNATAQAVRNQLAGRDLASDRAGTNAKHFRRLGDCEKFDLIVSVTTTTKIASRFQIVVARGLNSRAHFAALPAAASASRSRCQSRRAR
jgi:hypothetical protein